MEKQSKQYLKSKYGKYLTRGEEPIAEYTVGFYRIIATNKQLICLRKFPMSFMPVVYGNIINLEHHVYISWGKLLKSIILLAISAYGYVNHANANAILAGLLSFLEKNVPEIAGIISSTPVETLTDMLLSALLLLGLIYLLGFLLSLLGKLRISLRGAPSIRISTPFTKDVRDLIKKVETLKEGEGEEYVETEVEEELKELKPSHSYLIMEDKAEKSFSLFLNAVRSGCRGIYISRINPGQIKKEYSSEVDFQLLSDFMSIYWLTDSVTDERSISPEPDQLFAFITDFIADNESSVILLDGLEYLISHANFERILRFVQGINDAVGVHNSRLIIPINPHALSEKEMALLGRDMNIVS